MHLDSQQHFWHYNPAHQVRMTDQMDVLRRDYLPDELRPLLAAIEFGGSIVVQARQMIEETEWLLKLADEHDIIRGVVGWVDLRSPNLREQLERYAQLPKLVGVRHVVHDEPDDHFMLRAEFRRGIAQLSEFGLTYDLLLFPRHLPVAVKLVQEFPSQPCVLDHLAKPLIRDGQVSPWKEDLQRLAEFPPVFCKLSGLVTEAKWKQWRPEDFHRYLDIVIDAFGTNRVMIGSDWPVCTLCGDYVATMRIVLDYLQQFPPAVRDDILGGLRGLSEGTALVLRSGAALGWVVLHEQPRQLRLGHDGAVSPGVCLAAAETHHHGAGRPQGEPVDRRGIAGGAGLRQELPLRA